ncbi:MAG: NAD(P)/FAD-dependent oxidoreductase [Gammaproteobacteria bacterium]|nr:NAD(P)/FAD-dependent oxidoreductase [Gammaproteobacteria bacterium]MBQ0838354.1 NAD(P)/FAD-dependent oxidoreductase [Gammaproteobacteria bacterium]
MTEVVSKSQSSEHDYDAVVVGAGIAGLYAVYKLREMGLRVRGIEAAPAVGGTWYWNCYPGARVDSQSYIYQYWFSDELIQEWDWQERFPPQAEVERYLNFVADKFELRDNFAFETRVTSADWDNDAQCWLIGTDQGESLSSRYFISCTGMLSEPKTPHFPGKESFQGTVVHTARYPREGLDLKGKRVGVIGSGATGIQLIQTIASEVEHLTVFQRSASYGVAMRNDQFDDAARDHWRSKSAELQEKVNNSFVGFDYSFENGSWYDHTPEQRQHVLEEKWQEGSLSMWVGTYPEMFTDEAVNEEISCFVRDKIRARINDPAIADRVIPTTHGFGTYRVPLENGYYDVYNRDNVELVDVKSAPIESFTAKGLQTSEKEYPLDVIIMATGFNAGTGSLARMNIRGREGLSLTDEWNKDIRTTLGLQVHGFPNLFTVAGPLAPSAAFCNMTTCLQQQVNWVTDCIAYLRAEQVKSIEPTEAKQDEWVDHHDEVANATLLAATQSWYTGANIEGKPSRLISYIGGVNEYHRICDEVQASGYEGFTKI